MNPVRVVIADEHRPISEGLKGLLEPEFDVVNVVASGHALLAAVREDHPDVIVAGVSLPGLSGIDAIRQLRREGIRTKAIVLGLNTDAVYAARALKAGASGYVPKHFVSGEIVTAIRIVLDDMTYVSSKIDGELPVDFSASEDG